MAKQTAKKKGEKTDSNTWLFSLYIVKPKRHKLGRLSQREIYNIKVKRQTQVCFSSTLKPGQNDTVPIFPFNSTSCGLAPESSSSSSPSEITGNSTVFLRHSGLFLALW